MAWHCRTRGDLWLSLLLPFVQHTLLFPPGLIHSGRVRRLVEVAFFDLHVRWLGGAGCYTPQLIGNLQDKMFKLSIVQIAIKFNWISCCLPIYKKIVE